MIYLMLKKVLESEVYDKEDILNKMDFYLLKDRITQENYEELYSIMFP